jgi:hypothetical protein
MKKICLQSGHKGVTSGQTGASGERDWTTKIVPLIANILKSKGIEVYETDAFANQDPKVTGTDWDLFLAVHYDGDSYNDRGGFVDYPDKSVDASYERSRTLATTLSETYFKRTGIPERPQRSNANTKFYYMWAALSPNTPCAIIECGVGARKPEDYNILRNYDLISNAIADGILEGLGIPTGNELAILQKKYDDLLNELVEMRSSRDKWKRMFSELELKCTKDTQSATEHAQSLQSTVAEQANTITALNQTTQTSSKEKTTLTEAYNAKELELVAVTAKKNAEIENLMLVLKQLEVKSAKWEKKYNDLKKAGKKFWEFWK